MPLNINEWNTPKDVKARQAAEAKAIKVHAKMNQVAHQNFANCNEAIEYNFKHGNITQSAYNDAKKINQNGNKAKHNW